jgi:uncharacterized membrane protein
MSDLVCIAFKDLDSADKLLNELRTLQKEYLVDLEDACVVIRDAAGKVHLKQAANLLKLGALSGGTSGALWGGLIGLLFLNPLAGLLAGSAIGAGVGALTGSMADFGINDEFIASLGSTIPPGTSALFVLFRKVTLDRVMPDLTRYGGTLLKTSLSNEQEEKLRAALNAQTAVA